MLFEAIDDGKIALANANKNVGFVYQRLSVKKLRF